MDQAGGSTWCMHSAAEITCCCLQHTDTALITESSQILLSVRVDIFIICILTWACLDILRGQLTQRFAFLLLQHLWISQSYPEFSACLKSSFYLVLHLLSQAVLWSSSRSREYCVRLWASDCLLSRAVIKWAKQTVELLVFEKKKTKVKPLVSKVTFLGKDVQWYVSFLSSNNGWKVGMAGMCWGAWPVIIYHQKCSAYRLCAILCGLFWYNLIFWITLKATAKENKCIKTQVSIALM